MSYIVQYHFKVSSTILCSERERERERPRETKSVVIPPAIKGGMAVLLTS